MLERVYKICSKEEWAEAKRMNVFVGSEIDKVDGFIHLSTASQVKETAKLHFKGKKNLILLEVKTINLELRWEKSRNKTFFPHLYSNLPTSEISKEHSLTLDSNNNHVFPPWLKSI